MLKLYYEIIVKAGTPAFSVDWRWLCEESRTNS
nr:MAG TPA: hypothetical protein [Caudoviricetes sp.]